MYPDLFGIKDSSYIICIVLGIVLALLIAVIYLRKIGKKDSIIDFLLCSCFALISGFIFAILFENLYELIKFQNNYHWVWKMTFFGGFIGGIGGFLLTYFFLRKTAKFELKDILPIAPVSLSLGHFLGRIGCFLAGCCYGKHTDSWIGIEFPLLGKVIPTQLIEALFLALLFTVLAILLFKKNFKFGALIYFISYSVFRFVIEFYRGDERGMIGVLSPSQILCIIFLVSSVPLYFLMKKWYQNEKK